MESRMKEIAEWLARVEQMAGTLYKDAAALFADDRKFAGILRHLSDDEERHFHIMKSAVEYFQERGDVVSPIALEDVTRERVEAPFLKYREMLSAGTLTKEDMLDCIVDAEYSEWNDIFLYVVNVLKERSYEFSRGASKLQQHMKYITGFIESLPGSRKHQEAVRQIQSVWKERILLVEDMAPLVVFLKAVLAKEGIVEHAENGREGLAKVSEQYYDAIISDLKMPVMDGMEFYRKAAERDPGIGKRFLFFGTLPSREDEDFIRKNNLRYIRKPASITELRQTVRSILHGLPERS